MKDTRHHERHTSTFFFFFSSQIGDTSTVTWKNTDVELSDKTDRQTTATTQIKGPIESMCF